MSFILAGKPDAVLVQIVMNAADNPLWSQSCTANQQKLAKLKLFSLFIFNPNLGVCEVAAFWENLDRGGGNGTREIIEGRKLADR